MDRLRREPFRLLFPVGAALAWAAVLPWVLFGTGMIRSWLGVYHALTMTQGFIVAIAFGFIGTMIPRRTGARPLGTLELLLPIAALVAVPLCLLAGWIAAAELAYLIVLATLVQFAVRRLKRAARPPHPSFVFLPVGLAGGMAGAVLIASAMLGGPPALLQPGRALAEEGFLLSLVLAMAPMLASQICHGRSPPNPSEAAYRRQRLLHLLAAALLFGSFAVQFAVSERAGMFLRGAVIAAEVAFACRAAQVPTVAGLHRRLFWCALLLVPVGELAAGVRPAYRVPLLHLTFIGGFSLMVFAVSFHVVFLHTGRDALARRRPWPVALVGGLVLLAAVARATAERLFASHYFEALATASSLWLFGALVWGTFLVRLIVQPTPERSY